MNFLVMKNEWNGKRDRARKGKGSRGYEQHWYKWISISPGNTTFSIDNIGVDEMDRETRKKTNTMGEKRNYITKYKLQMKFFFRKFMIRKQRDSECRPEERQVQTRRKPAKDKGNQSWGHMAQNENMNTVTPRNTGRQRTNQFHLLLADFCYCQYRKLKEMTWRDNGLAFVIGGFPLLLGPVLRGLTVIVLPVQSIYHFSIRNPHLWSDWHPILIPRDFLLIEIGIFNGNVEWRQHGHFLGTEGELQLDLTIADVKGPSNLIHY